MGHADRDMSDLYDKIRQDVKFRKEVAEKAGLGFELPSKTAVVGTSGICGVRRHSYQST
jgi:hypothetical protein